MEEQQDHIEKYLKGELSAEERILFEKILEKDATLKQEVEQHRHLLRGLELGFNQELKALLIDEESKIIKTPGRQSSRIKTLYPLIGVAAAVVILIIAYFSFQKDSLGPEALYAQYYEIYPNVEEPVSRSENVGDSPYAYYERGNYSTALKLFAEMRITDYENPALIFYSGMCQLELGQSSIAIELFDEVVSMQSEKYARPSYWYQAMAYLNLGNAEKASTIFRQLQQGEDVYARKAQELLEQL